MLLLDLWGLFVSVLLAVLLLLLVWVALGAPQWMLLLLLDNKLLFSSCCW
jgi:hypothetical protein